MSLLEKNLHDIFEREWNKQRIFRLFNKSMNSFKVDPKSKIWNYEIHKRINKIGPYGSTFLHVDGYGNTTWMSAKTPSTQKK